MLTKGKFCDTYRTALALEFDWARSERALDEFMMSVMSTIGYAPECGRGWNHGSDVAKKVWSAAKRAEPGLPRYSLKALRALPHVELGDSK